MRTRISCALVFVILARPSFAQLYLEPLVGYQIDAANGGDFTMINSALQLSYKFNKHTEVFFRAQKSWPFSRTFNDSAFTTNPSLPLSSIARKTIGMSDFSFATGDMIRLNGRNRRNVFAILFFAGYCSRTARVRYALDKNNYTILNPDKNRQSGDFFVGGGFEYMRRIKNNRLLIQLDVSAPPIVKKDTYPYSFVSMVPFSVNLGYSMMLKKFFYEK